MTGSSLKIDFLSFGLWSQRHLKLFFDESLEISLRGASKATVKAYLGWGTKASGRRAELQARAHDKPCWLIEDGFVRSIAAGKQAKTLSLVVDNLGIYYDCSRPSALERSIAGTISPEQHRRASQLINLWRIAGISKYNEFRDFDVSTLGRYVLVADQTLNDNSVLSGGGCAESFRQMLKSAISENPGLKIVVKTHPEVVSGKKKGYLSGIPLPSHVVVLADPIHPHALICAAESVYVVTSQIGFEGLILGKKVRCFAMPFFAGWGLTIDSMPRPDRRCEANLERLVYSAFVDYSRYVHPETFIRCEVEDIIDWVQQQRRLRHRYSPTLYAVNFSKWKQPFVRQFHQGSDVIFCPDLDVVPVGGSVVLWGKSLRSKIAGRPDIKQFICVEDGFLRSVGLGAALTRPMSWVQDDVGIYYDATTISKLEMILSTHVFDPSLIERANTLCMSILSLGITKYNLNSSSIWSRAKTSDRLVILVLGQVESDASIKFGSSSIRTNFELVQNVRNSNPNAYILYKPHPDVVEKLRDRGESEGNVSSLCDEVLIRTDLNALFPLVDEVHVLTSLGGFEALIRGLKVVTYGNPFYAGWGLTHDLGLSTEVRRRRNRLLSVEEMVAAALILYPTYVSRETGYFVSVECALAELVRWRKKPDRVTARVMDSIARLTRKRDF